MNWFSEDPSLVFLMSILSCPKGWFSDVMSWRYSWGSFWLILGMNVVASSFLPSVREISARIQYDGETGRWRIFPGLKIVRFGVILPFSSKVIPFGRRKRTDRFCSVCGFTFSTRDWIFK